EWLVQQCVDQSGRRTDHHLRDERTFDVADQHAKLGLADAKGVLQDGGEDRLKPAGRARDDAQHLRGGCLLRPPLVELALVLFELPFQVSARLAHLTNARSPLRSGRTKLAAARWAIWAFERQGHLVGAGPGG